MSSRNKTNKNPDLNCGRSDKIFGSSGVSRRKTHFAAICFLSIYGAQAQANDFYCTYSLRDSSDAIDYFQSTSSNSQSESCYSARHNCETSASRYPGFYCSLHDSGTFGYVYQSSRINCSSFDGRRETCSVEGRIENIRLTRQISRSECEGNWGYTASFIWVVNGCRAEFAVDSVTYKSLPPVPTPDRGTPGGPDLPGRPGGQNPGEETKSIYCASSDMRYNSCNVGGQIQDFVIDTQHSRSECTQGTSYGAGRDYIWVDKGCRGLFKVRVWNSL